jgi:HlyD family secretion protein
MSVSFRPGQSVNAGQALLRIDPAPYLSRGSALKAQFDQAAHQLSGISWILTSLDQKENLVPDVFADAKSRFSAFWSEQERIKFGNEQDRVRWQEEQRLPAAATTPIRIRDLEWQYRKSSLELQSHSDDFESQIMSEKSSTALHLAELKSEIDQNELAVSQTTVCAPVTGTVQEIASLNPGDYLQSSQEILKVIPNQLDDLRVELHVAPNSIGKLTVGMSVRLRFPAFQYFQFGGANGRILAIDPDVSQPNNGDPFFTVLTDLDRKSMTDKKGSSYSIKVGLSADARIVLKARSVLDFVLDQMSLSL